MKQGDPYPEVSAIANDVCSGCATKEQLERLEVLLKGNFDAQQFYYDYISIHARLSAGSKRHTALVYRRITEELVLQQDHRLTENLDVRALEHPLSPSYYRADRLKWLCIVLLVLLTTIASLLWLNWHRTPSLFVAHIVEGRVSLVGQGDIDNKALLPGVYRADTQATIKLINGDNLHLRPHSLIKIFNHREIRLRSGKLTLEALTSENTLVHTHGAMLHSNGGGLTLDLQYAAPRVTSGENTVLIPARWRPNHYWPFDSQSDRVVDRAGSAHGMIVSGATRTDGLVGKGAMMFDGSENARIALGSGGGTTRGSGSFSASDGVTIEAFIRPAPSAILSGVQHIFRKDSLGGRIQLSIESVSSASTGIAPHGQTNHSAAISFGLFILGQGYHELKLPLDGRAGRLSLAEITSGSHHVVATYSARTGEKAIYLNGKKSMSYQYPLGSKMVSGGSGEAIIGNTPRERLWHKEAFLGVIDEVAFYSFALSDYMIHFDLNNVKQGLNYYGLPTKPLVDNTALPARPRLTLIPHTTYALTPAIGLPKKIIVD